MTHEELVAKVEDKLDEADNRSLFMDYRTLAALAIRIVVEACVTSARECSCRGEDECGCNCAKRIGRLAGP